MVMTQVETYLTLFYENLGFEIVYFKRNYTRLK